MNKVYLIFLIIIISLLIRCETDKSGTNYQNIAFLRIVHTAADPAVDVVDIYVNGEKTGILDDFTFGSITGYIQIPGSSSANIIIANKNSNSVSDQVIESFNTVPLNQGKKYIAVLAGVLNTLNFTNPDPVNRDISLKLYLISEIRENAVDPSVVDLLVFHGSTDAPSIDLVVDGVTPPQVDNLDFGKQTANYITVDPAISTLDITDSNNNSSILASYNVDFSSYAGKSIILFTSGFLNVSQNQYGPSFRLLTIGTSTTAGKMKEPKPDYSQITNIVYSQHIQPIFQNNCVSCHSGANAGAGLKLDSWDNLILGSDRSDKRSGESIIPFDSENSLLIEMLKNLVNGPHPFEQGGDTLSTETIEFLARWIDEGAKNDNGTAPYENSTNRIYVCNQDAGIISVIDTDAKLVIRNIDLHKIGYSATPKPHDLAVEPDGSHWYVSLINDGKVVKFDNNFNIIADADFESAGILSMHPTKDLLYVGHTLSVPNVPQTIGTITRSTMNLVTIPVPYERPHAFVADHQGRYVYSASLTQNHFGIIDTDVNPTELAAAIPFSSTRTLVQMNISPDDQEIYISSQLTQQLLILDCSVPTNLTLIDSVTVQQQPWHPKFTPDGTKVYVGNNLSNTVSVVNTSTRMQETVVGLGDGTDGLAEPHGLVISPDGQYVYVTNRNKNGEYIPRYNLGTNAFSGTVTVINTATNTIEKVIEIEEFPSGLGIYHE